MKRRVWATILLCLLASPTTATRAEGASDQSAGSAAREQLRELRANLRRTSIQAPTEAPPDKTKDSSLEEAIRGVLAFEVTPKPKPKPRRSEPQQASTTQHASPSTQPVTVETIAVPNPAHTHPAAPRKIPPRTLQRLMQLSPSGVSRPITLGDSLHRGGYDAEAFKIYQMAMQREPSPEDRAWVLFQMANCKRKTDPEMAMGIYKRLLHEHPTSAWSDMAQTECDFLKWVQDNDPTRALADANALAKTLSKSAPQTPTKETEVTSPVETNER